MDNEIPLPPPPRIRHRSPTSSSPARPPRSPRPSFQKPRHLSRVDDLSSQPASSDPALFSSDDIPASGVENYHASGAGKKRRYRGTWWGETVMDPKKKRMDFKEKRFVDSGVWMGSDESGAESLLLSEDAPTGGWGEDLIKDARDARGPSSLRQTASHSRNALKKVEEPKEHQLARAVVNDCLEKGQDSVDLSSGNLRTIPPGLLRPLQHLTKLPPVKEPPITEEIYSSLHPFLRLFLSGNSLSALSSELFELSTIYVLSLRNNKLTEIPPAVRRLTALQAVNVSVNRLQCLPWDLLWLIWNGDLKHMIVRPNPLMQIDGAEIAQWHYQRGSSEGEIPQMHEYGEPAPADAWSPIHVATGPIRRFNMEGMPLFDGQKNGLSTSDIDSRAPSLREVALRAFTKSPFFDQVVDSEEMEYCPQLVTRLVRQAREVKNAGGRVCSVCQRGFVIARTEWIEWWDCSTHENGLKGPRSPGEKLRPLPFRRLGCSWGCVPDGRREITLPDRSGPAHSRC